MILFKNARMSIASYLMKKSISNLPRNKGTYNLESAKNIGIIYVPDSQKDTEVIKQFCNKLKEKNKNITVFGFLQNKNALLYQYDEKGYNYVNYKELNFWLEPKTKLTSNFIEQEFDLLINLNISKSFQLNYISAFSKAKLKVGSFKDDTFKSNDLLINITDKDNIKNLIEYIVHYLNIINTK